MNIYMVVLKSGHKFYVESYQSYDKIFSRYYQRYGDNLACVIKEYLYDSIDDIKAYKK